jgi:hypothetical protein
VPAPFVGNYRRSNRQACRVSWWSNAYDAYYTFRDIYIFFIAPMYTYRYGTWIRSLAQSFDMYICMSVVYDSMPHQTKTLHSLADYRYHSWCASRHTKSTYLEYFSKQASSIGRNFTGGIVDSLSRSREESLSRREESSARDGYEGRVSPAIHGKV